MCFIYAFDQSDTCSQLFVKKIWGTASYFFFENWTRGTSHLKFSYMFKFLLSNGRFNLLSFSQILKFIL